MHIRDFIEVFRPVVRTWNNWDQLARTCSGVSLSACTTLSDLGELFTVWHVDPSGNLLTGGTVRADT